MPTPKIIRPPSPYGVNYFSAPLVSTTANGWTQQAHVVGKGLRIVTGTRNIYRLRFHRGNAAPVEYPGELYDGLVLPVEFDGLSFIFGDIASAPAAEPWLFEIYENRQAVVAGTEIGPRELEYRNIFRSAEGGNAIGAGSAQALYESENDNEFPVAERQYQFHRKLSRDAYLVGWISAVLDFDVYLSCKPDPDYLTAGSHRIVARFDAVNYAAIPATIHTDASQFAWMPGRNLSFAGGVGEMNYHHGILVPRGEFTLYIFNPGIASTYHGRLDLVLI